MTETIWLQLGIAAPLVVILLYLLKQSTDERREITTKFLAALQTTVEQSNEQRLRASNELAQLTDVIREDKKLSADEHARIVESIDKLYLRASQR